MKTVRFYQGWVLAGILGVGVPLGAYDSYDISIPPHVMKGDRDVSFRVTPLSGATPDNTPHNIFFTLPVGLQTNPQTNPPGGTDWTSISNWGLLSLAGALPGNNAITVTEGNTLSPVTTTKFFDLQNTVRSFEIVSPESFVGMAGSVFQIRVRAKDGLSGGGAVVSGFNDDVILSASIGDIIVNGSGNIVSGGDFVDGEALVSVALLGTNVVSRINRITVTATVNYLSLGLASGFVDVNINPGGYSDVVLLFPGETLTPGKVLTKKVGAANPATANIPVDGVVVYLVDQNGNPIISPPAPVSLLFESLYAGSPNDAVPGLKVINFGNSVISSGEFNFFRGNTTHQVRVYDQDNPGTINDISSLFVNSGVAALIEVGAVPSPQRPGRPFLVSARVVDGTLAANTVVTYNNPAVSVKLTNCAGTAFPINTLDTNPGAAGVQTTVSFVNGVLSPHALQIFPRANPVCINFDDNAGRFGESNGFQVLTGDQIQLLVLLPDQTFTTGQYPGYTPSVPVARKVGEVPDVRVMVVDQGWNIVDSVTGGWTPGPVSVRVQSRAGVDGYVDLTQGTANMPASGFEAVVQDVRLRTAYPGGDGVLRASLGGLTGYSAPFTINPETYNQMIFVSPGETLSPGIPPGIEPDGKLGIPSDQSVNIPFPIGVYLTDVYFNPIVNPPATGWPSLTFALTAPLVGEVQFPFANPFLMADSSFNSQVTLGTMGANTLRVNDTTGKIRTQNINVVPGGVSYFLVTPNPGSTLPDAIPIQNVGVPFNLTFKAFDGFGNIATNFSGDVRLELLENGTPRPYAGTISPNTVTFVADPVRGGVVTVPVTITYAGSSLGSGADQLQVRAVYNNPVPREGLSSFFSVREELVWAGVVLTLSGETRTPGLGLSSLKTGVPTPVTAGNSFAATVTAVDRYGNRLDQAAVADLAVLTPNVFAHLGSPARITLSEGSGTSFIQVYTAGSVALNATVVSDSFSSTSTLSIRVGSYAADTGRLVLLAPGEVLLPGSPTEPGKDSSAVSPIQANTATSFTILACDRFHNRDTSWSGNPVSLVSDDGAISVSNVSVQSGSATVSNVFLRGNLPNPSLVRVTATDSSDSNKASWSDVPVTPGALYRIDVPNVARVGVDFPMTVTLLDPDTGLPIASAHNSITLTGLTPEGTEATVPLNVRLINLVNGTVTFNQNYGAVEPIKIRVTDSFNRMSDSGLIDVKPNGLKYRVTLPPEAKTTDDVFPVTVGLYDTVQDALPIRSSNYQHTFQLSVEAGGLAALGAFPVTSATLTEGEAQFNFSYTKAEHIVVRASGSVAEFNGIVGLDDMDVLPGAYVKVQILAPGEVAVPGVPSLTGKDSTGLLSQPAQQSFSVAVNAVDRYWNIVASQNTPLNPSLHVSASDGSLSPPPQGFSNGQALFTGLQLRSPPQVTLTAQDTSSDSLFPQSVVVFVSGRRYVATPQDQGTIYSGPPRTFNLDVALYSFTGVSTGALITGYSGDVSVEPLSLSLEPLPVENLVIPPNQTQRFPMDPSGVLTLTLAYAVADDVILKFTDEDGWQGYSDVIHLVPRDVRYEMTTPESSLVGPPTTFPMTITPRDADTGTVPKNWASTVALTPMSSLTGLPGDGTLQVVSCSLNGGPLSFNQAYSKTGSVRFRLSDGSRVFDSAPMLFLPGPLSSLTTDLPDTLEPGTAQSVAVTIFDLYGNPIPSQPVEFRLSPSSLGELSLLTGTTDAQGQATTVFTPNEQSGPGDFYVSSEGTSVRRGFRLLGPPVSSLSVGGQGVSDGQGYSLKPEDPIQLTTQMEEGLTLLGLHYSVDGGDWRVYDGAFHINETGTHSVRYYGETQLLRVHTETMKTSPPLFVSRTTLPEEGLVNYPNPFRAGVDVTFLEYTLASDSGVDFTLYDLGGRLVYTRTYSQGEEGGRGGFNRVLWDGKNNDGVTVANGGYVAVLRVAQSGQTLKRKIAVKK